jgi:hypothetical protein
MSHRADTHAPLTSEHGSCVPPKCPVTAFELPSLLRPYQNGARLNRPLQATTFREPVGGSASNAFGSIALTGESTESVPVSRCIGTVTNGAVAVSVG